MAKYKKGESGNPAGKPKGAISEKTRFWNELKDWMTEGGAEKFKVEMAKLNGKDYINAYNGALEYFQPKLSRTTVQGDAENPLEHHITLKLK